MFSFDALFQVLSNADYTGGFGGISVTRNTDEIKGYWDSNMFSQISEEH